MHAYKMLIDGQLVEGAKTIEIVNPATGRPFTTAPAASEDQLNAAVAAARRAFPAWAATPWDERRNCLLLFAQRLEEEVEDFANLLVKEQGKPLAEARFEVGATLQGIRYYASAELGAETRSHANGSYEIERRPLGVVAAITPWNYPLILASNKFSPALLTGNTVVLKPAPTTPLTSLELGRLASEIFPAGVFNVIADDNDLGSILTGHPDIAKISFTGSTGTGKRVMHGAAETLKRVTLELGGKSPVVIMPDVDVATAAPGAAGAIFFNSGQVCVAGSRLYAHRSIFDQVIEGVAATTPFWAPRASLDPEAHMGPLVSKEQFDRVMGYIEAGKRDGASVAVGGDAAPADGGYYVNPTVLVDVNPQMSVVREEIFGPVVVAQRFDDLDEVAREANNTCFGLGAGVWTKDVATMHKLASKIKSGTVWGNCHAVIDTALPFGGFKESGLGREQGRQGIEAYMETKTVIIQL